jgi:hypothetical protein
MNYFIYRQDSHQSFHGEQELQEFIHQAAKVISFRKKEHHVD